MLDEIGQIKADQLRFEANQKLKYISTPTKNSNINICDKSIQTSCKERSESIPTQYTDLIYKEKEIVFSEKSSNISTNTFIESKSVSYTGTRTQPSTEFKSDCLYE